MKSLCIFCGSSGGTKPLYLESARAVGAALAREKITVVYGGASVGVMGAIADGALSAGGRAIGVIPESLFSKEVAHEGLTTLHRVRSMHERKTLMYDLADGFIALPGGLGTLEEIFEIMTWAQLGLHQKPCGFLNVDGYFDALIQFLDRTVIEGFLKPKHRRLVLVENSLKKLLTRFREFKPAPLEGGLRKDEV